MASAARHKDWIPPKADLGSDIIIRPSNNASYIPSKWVFELDKDAVFRILIKDAYANPYAFIRELIQNSLDAIRCKMISDIARAGIESPEYPTLVDKATRDKYPLTIDLIEKTVKNDLSCESEIRQVLIVNDCGIGMDREVIERYFLQVGRSYYTTDEFKRTYRFTPTSQFGVGFLSVFGATDHVTVDTFKNSSRKNDAIRLTLTGPRNYLLTDKSARRTNGTRIEVLLRTRLDQGVLTKMVSQWCRKVEFPLIVNDLGVSTTIEAEVPEQFTYDIEDVTEENARFILRSFPINRSGIEGELYVFTRVTELGESWADKRWAEHQYSQKHPAAMPPPIPESIVCLHGILINYKPLQAGYGSSMICRLDYRRNVEPSLSRENMHKVFSRGPYVSDCDVQSRWEELLQEHIETSKLASGPTGWMYKQMLVDSFNLPTFWLNIDGMIPLYSRNGNRKVALSCVQNMAIFSTIISMSHNIGVNFPKHKTVHGRERKSPEWDSNVEAIRGGDILSLSENHRRAIFAKRIPTNLRLLGRSHLAVDWICNNIDGHSIKVNGKSLFIIEMPDKNIIGFPIHKTTDSTYECNLLNINNIFVKWLLSIKDVCEEGKFGFSENNFSTLMSLLFTPVHYRGHELNKLQAYIEAWRDLPNLNEELYPPDISFSREMFHILNLLPSPVSNVK